MSKLFSKSARVLKPFTPWFSQRTLGEDLGRDGDGAYTIIDKDDCPEGTFAKDFSKSKKWRILTVIFLVQCSMNLNASLYSNAQEGIARQFWTTEKNASYGAAIFLIAYAFGCELWAPWSEELGRKSVLQASLLLVNIWQIPVALAPSMHMILFSRFMGGLSSAGGSVTLGIIADMFTPDEQQYAVAYISFASVFGSIIGPIAGGFMEDYLHWTWCIWVQLIVGVAVQLLHLFMVPETRSTTRMDNFAKAHRKNDPQRFGRVYGPGERVGPWYNRMSKTEIFKIWLRPFKMLCTDPIVLVLSLLSGFSDALIFMQIQSFGLVYDQWDFTYSQLGLAFIPIGLGYVLGWFSYLPVIRRDRARRAETKPHDKNYEWTRFESRLWWLLYLAPTLCIGLLIFGWTSGGPPMPWAPSMVGSALIGIANYAIYYATIDYMIATYGAYSSSATGGNGFMRDFLAGFLTMFSKDFYQCIPPKKYEKQMASTLLFVISVALVVALFYVYKKGAKLRQNSKFAKSLWEDVGGNPVVSGGGAPNVPIEMDEMSSSPPMTTSTPDPSEGRTEHDERPPQANPQFVRDRNGILRGPSSASLDDIRRGNIKPGDATRIDRNASAASLAASRGTRRCIRTPTTDGSIIRVANSTDESLARVTKSARSSTTALADS